MAITDNASRVSIIAALSKNTRAIGHQNQLLWHISDDLKRFKELTRGHPVVMGRRTFESILSILGKPLPGRSNIVITSRPEYESRGAEVVASIEDALERARALNNEELFIIGGQQIYEQSLPYTHRLYLTLVDSDKEGDTWFPPYEDTFTQELHREAHRTEDGISYEWLTLERP